MEVYILPSKLSYLLFFYLVPFVLVPFVLVPSSFYLFELIPLSERVAAEDAAVVAVVDFRPLDAPVAEL